MCGTFLCKAGGEMWTIYYQIFPGKKRIIINVLSVTSNKLSNNFADRFTSGLGRIWPADRQLEYADINGWNEWRDLGRTN
jgi:hypothetical protein